MNTIASMVEFRCMNQAKRIFNNNLTKLIIKLREEVKELDSELFSIRIDKEKVLDEIADVLYVLNQICNLFDTNFEECLKRAYMKIKEREESNKINKHERTNVHSTRRL